jgi:hypothetical protein
MLVAAMMLLVGFQLIYSAVFLRIYGFTQGFLPDQPQLRVWLRRITLEKGVITGMFLALTGFLLLLFASLKWQSTGFGALDPVSSVRQVVPAVTLLTLGVQVVFGSFFLSSLATNINSVKFAFSKRKTPSSTLRNSKLSALASKSLLFITRF